jgi:hypothetical protein
MSCSNKGSIFLLRVAEHDKRNYLAPYQNVLKCNSLLMIYANDASVAKLFILSAIDRGKLKCPWDDHAGHK